MEGKNFEDIAEKENTIESKLREKRDFMYSKRAKIINQKFAQQAAELETKYHYPDIEKYYLYHILISSTIDR